MLNKFFLWKCPHCCKFNSCDIEVSDKERFNNLAKIHTFLSEKISKGNKHSVNLLCHGCLSKSIVTKSKDAPFLKADLLSVSRRCGEHRMYVCSKAKRSMYSSRILDILKPLHITVNPIDENVSGLNILCNDLDSEKVDAIEGSVGILAFPAAGIQKLCIKVTSVLEYLSAIDFLIEIARKYHIPYKISAETVLYPSVFNNNDYIISIVQCSGYIEITSEILPLGSRYFGLPYVYFIYRFDMYEDAFKRSATFIGNLDMI